MNAIITNNFYNQIAKFPLLSEEQEKALFIKAQTDSNAKTQFINSNLRLVLAIAKKYKGRGIPFEDLVQEGSIGLVKAFEQFDLDKGYKFSTFATYWIKQVIGKAFINKSKMVRTPAYLYEIIGKIKKLQGESLTANGVELTPKELAKKLNLTEKQVKNALSVSEVVSLEKPVGKEEDGTLGELIKYEDKGADEQYEEEFSNNQIANAVNELNEKEKMVIAYRFGLDGKNEKTLEEIGEILGLTKTRIKQIETEALRKLRRNKQLIALAND